MKHIAILSIVLFCASISPLRAQSVSLKTVEIVPRKGYQPLEFKGSAELQTLLNSAVAEALAALTSNNFKTEELAATLIDLRNPKNIRFANIRGEERIYPASVVKMFYMAALEQQLEDRKIKLTPELERGLKDMIVDSSNEATQYILDVITDTSSGAEMPAKEFQKWSYKRNIVNRYYKAMGYERINVNQKTFCEDAYGREQQFRNYHGENRNMLNTNATARLLAEIVLGRAGTGERTKTMMGLLKRDPFAKTTDENDQAHGFSGKALIDKKMTSAMLWSKAGWTSKARHDAAYIETPDGLKFVLVIFTENHAADRETIPAITGKIIDGLKKIKE